MACQLSSLYFPLLEEEGVVHFLSYSLLGEVGALEMVVLKMVVGELCLGEGVVGLPLREEEGEGLLLTVPGLGWILMEVAEQVISWKMG